MSALQQPSIREIQPSDLLEKVRSGAVRMDQIIDVREEGEWEYYRLEGSRHIPMNSIPEHLPELDAEEEWFLMCAHGVRSLYVLDYMRKQGFSNLLNVTGGISAAASELGFSYD
ncbi:rhodanese-like domain-containing protein [Paenibacillus sp. D51F]